MQTPGSSTLVKPWNGGFVPIDTEKGLQKRNETQVERMKNVRKGKKKEKLLIEKSSINYAIVLSPLEGMGSCHLPQSPPNSIYFFNYPLPNACFSLNAFTESLQSLHLVCAVLSKSQGHHYHPSFSKRIVKCNRKFWTFHHQWSLLFWSGLITQIIPYHTHFIWHQLPHKFLIHSKQVAPTSSLIPHIWYCTP